MKQNIKKQINYSYQAFDFTRKHARSLSKSQTDDEIDRAKYALKHDLAVDLGCCLISPETYLAILIGGERFILEIMRLEDRLEINRDSSGLKPHIHSLLVNTRGNLEKAEEIEGISKEDLERILAEEEIYPDNYKWISWPTIKPKLSPVELASQSKYFAIKKDCFNLTLPVWKDAYNDFLRLYFSQVLRFCNKNKSKTARTIGLSRFGLDKAIERVNPDLSSKLFDLIAEPEDLPKYHEACREFDKLYCHAVLSLTHGNVTKGAEIAFLSRFGFGKIIKRSGIKSDNYRANDF